VEVEKNCNHKWREYKRKKSNSSSPTDHRVVSYTSQRAHREKKWVKMGEWLANCEDLNRGGREKNMGSSSPNKPNFQKSKDKSNR